MSPGSYFQITSMSDITSRFQNYRQEQNRRTANISSIIFYIRETGPMNNQYLPSHLIGNVRSPLNPNFLAKRSV